jgi:hypothetical protein
LVVGCGDSGKSSTANQPASGASGSYASLKLANSDGVTINEDVTYPKDRIQNPQYKQMFGIDHIGLSYQKVTAGGTEGMVTYYEFKSAEEVGTAIQNAQNIQKTRPREMRKYGNFVVSFQVTSHDEAQLEAFVDRLDPLLRGKSGS